MKPIAIDFLQRRPPSPGALALVVLALLACAAATWEFAQAQRELEIAREGIRRETSADDRRTAITRAARIDPARATAVNRAVSRLNTPWPALFDALERTLDDDVGLLAVEPDEQRRSARITAVTSSPKGITGFIAALGADEALAKPTLLKHEIDDRSPRRPYTFTVQVEWRDAP